MAIRNRTMRYKRRSVSASGVPELIPSNRCYFPKTTNRLLWGSGMAGTVLLLSLVFDGGFFINDNLRRDWEEVETISLADWPSNNANHQPQPSAAAIADHESRQASCRLMRNHRHLHECYPLGSVKKFEDPSCAMIQTWEAVQQCLFGRFEYDVPATTMMTKKAANISVVHILGERHSGTKFITEEVQKCFPKDRGFKIHRDFMRSKHFFQPIFWQENYHDRMMIVVVRDPYEWVAAMREKPYHAPNHCQIFPNGTVVPLPWHKFVQRRWTTHRSIQDEKLLRRADPTMLKSYICRNHFRIKQVMPCLLDNVTAQYPPWNIPPRLWRGFEPIYEQGRDGKPYQTVLDLRRDKIVHWVLQIPLVLRIGAFLVVRYEDVLEQGTGFLMDHIAEMTGRAKSATCQPSPPQPERIGKRKIPDDFRQWIRNNLNEETERLLGYI